MTASEINNTGKQKSSSFSPLFGGFRCFYKSLSKSESKINLIIRNLLVQKRQLRVTALLVLLPLAFAFSAFALPKDARGIVVDENGVPLKGVRVVVSRTMIFTSTDEKGRFTLKGIPEGSSIIFSCEGYKSHVMLPLMASNHSLYIKLVKDPLYRKNPSGDSTDPHTPSVPGGLITKEAFRHAVSCINVQNSQAGMTG